MRQNWIIFAKKVPLQLISVWSLACLFASYPWRLFVGIFLILWRRRFTNPLFCQAQRAFVIPRSLHSLWHFQYWLTQLWILLANSTMVGEIEFSPIYCDGILSLPQRDDHQSKGRGNLSTEIMESCRGEIISHTRNRHHLPPTPRPPCHLHPLPTSTP